MPRVLFQGKEMTIGLLISQAFPQRANIKISIY